MSSHLPGIILVLCLFLSSTKLTAGLVPSDEHMRTLFDGYNPKVPAARKGHPVLDTIQLYIVSIDSISDSSMDYLMSFYFRQRWIDPRLTFNFSDVDVLEMDKSVTNDIWLPDVYIINEKRAAFHDITVPNRLLNIYPDGGVFYSVRITGTFSCNMNLRKYPLDRQICDIRFESYGYSASTIIIRWKEPAAKLSPNLVLPQFELIKQEPFNCDGVYFGVNYTCVGLRFYLERSKGYYITQVYVPSVLIIILSWMNFWVSIDAVPARISLGLLTVLTMTTQTSTALANLQRVGYIKALDVWLAVCLLFVFAALIEFAFVNVATRVEQRRRQSSSTISELVKSTSNSNNNIKEENDTKEANSQKANQRREKARKIDKFSRVMFPVVFVVFNIAYWTFYSLWEPVFD